MVRGQSSIIVDAPNLRLRDLDPYVMLADIFKYKVELIHLKMDPTTAYLRNQHHASWDDIMSQARQFEQHVAERVLVWDKRKREYVLESKTFGDVLDEFLANQREDY